MLQRWQYQLCFKRTAFRNFAVLKLSIQVVERSASEWLVEGETNQARNPICNRKLNRIGSRERSPIIVTVVSDMPLTLHTDTATEQRIILSHVILRSNRFRGAH